MDDKTARQEQTDNVEGDDDNPSAEHTEGKKIDSLKKRYSFKLGANLTVLPISLVSQSLIARGLGPAAYGDFNFLTNFFTQAVGFFDTGTSLGLYTKLSQRQDEPGLVKFYWYFAGIVSILLVVLLVLTYILNEQNLFFPNQQLRFVGMALMFSLFTWFSTIVSKLVDAFGLTTGGEVFRVIQRVFSLALLLPLFFAGMLNLTSFFYYNYVIILALCFGWAAVLKRNGVAAIPRIVVRGKELRKYASEFYRYSSPLLSYSFVGVIVGILDLWLLQKFSGSLQQGYYALSFKMASVCFLFTNAMTPLLMREFSVAFGQDDIAEMKRLFTRFVPMFYTIAAILSVFLAVQADAVTVLFGGRAFEGASLPLALMALYPVHQTYGQLSGSVFYAIGKTKLYRNIGMTMMVIGEVVTFFLIAPRTLFGLNLGALGLAIKMVSVQFLSVNVQLFFNARFLSVNFTKFLLHQLIIAAILGLIALASRAISDLAFKDLIVTFLLSGVLYVTVTAILIYLFPQLIFMSREEKNQIVATVSKRLLKAF